MLGFGDCHAFDVFGWLRQRGCHKFNPITKRICDSDPKACIG